MTQTLQSYEVKERIIGLVEEDAPALPETDLSIATAIDRIAEEAGEGLKKEDFCAPCTN